MSNNQTQGFYVGSLITSVVGAVLLLLTDFAGWDGSNYYLGLSIEGSVGVSFEEPLSFILFLPPLVLLLFCAYVSVLGLQGNIQTKQITMGFYSAIGAMVYVIAGGLIFLVAILEDEPEYWWFDAGFFGGVIGSALTVLLFYYVLKQTTT